MSKFGKVYASLALEDDDVVDMDENTEVPAEIESDMADSQQEMAAIEDYEEAIDEGMDGAQQLDNTTDKMEELSEKNDGLSDDAVEMAEVSLEDIYRRMRLPYSRKTKRVMPALESFSTSSSRKETSRLAIEEIKEQGAKIWERIKEFFKKLWESLVVAINNVVGIATKLDTYAAALEKRVADAKSKNMTSKAGEFEDASIFGAFGWNGKVDGKVVSEVLKGQESLSDGITTSLAELAGGVTKEALDAIKSDNANFAEAAKGLMTGSIGKLKSLKTFGKVQASGTEVTLPVAGAKAISVSFENGNVKVSEEKTTYGGTGKGEVKTLSLEEMSQVISDSINLLASTEKYKDKIKVAQDSVKNIDKVVDEAIAKLKKGGGDSAAMTTVRSAAVSAIKAQIQVLRMTAGYNASAAKFALNYVTRSLKQYEAPAATDDKK